MLSTPMTTLNNRLQLALLNRKKGKNALEKGFTLVELMIVIVIVGVLSAVALPNFLGQQNKAKITEATSKISAILKSAHAEYTYSSDEDDAITQALSEATTATETGRFTFTPLAVDGTTTLATGTALSPSEILIVGATPNAADSALYDSATISGAQGHVFGCVNLNTGAIDIGRNFKTSVE